MSAGIRVVPVFIPMMGCTHQCVFCNQHAVTGISGSRLLADIREQLLHEMSCFTPAGYNEIAFFGGSFTCLDKGIQGELLDMAQPFIDSGMIQGIRFSTRPDYIEHDHLLWLKSKGVVTIELGIQSTDEEVLRVSGRGHGAADIFISSRLIKSAGFKLGLQMMIGLPGDTPHKSTKTALDIIGLRPDFVRIYPTLVLEGSPLQRLLEDGSYRPLSLEEAVELVARLKILFEAHDIPVIRTGLQANEGLDSGRAYIAGPYHPAFGEMADSRIYYYWMEDAIQRLLCDIASPKDIALPTNTASPGYAPSPAPISITFGFNPSEISKAIGQKRSVLKALIEKHPGLFISINGDISVDRGRMRMELDEWKSSLRLCEGLFTNRNSAAEAENNLNGASRNSKVLYINRRDYIERAARLITTQCINEVQTFAAEKDRDLRL
jgi:radical SAM superfamily enzyme